uniref:NADH-ubiquinone oxidoreductase chain 2 n=1 Tax=Layahima wuzhishana TaxID=2905905 RepID=A0A8K1XXF2_9NEOP|nr:NADH dehydrogenase subunit 2 [Layahima wuzhishana]UHM24915.1 NADH dehydrogenase subunit 2 [Layahima wuzhishana]UHM24928.1 NADH dehydrogenase subunit 2 [Layahima wuzhishana]
MFNNLTNFTFALILMLGSILSISSNSWLGAWMGLEINLLSFIPLLSNLKNLTSTESSLKYFIVQALASTTLLFVILLLSFNQNYSFEYYPHLNIILNSALLMKMGAAPFHSWFPEVMEGLSWSMSFILMTWQKIAPMILISYCLFHKFIFFTIVTSILVGSIGGINQTNLRSLMAYSSINHLGWMLSSLLISLNHWMVYFLFYSTLSLSIVHTFYQFNVFYFSQVFSMLSNMPILKFSLFCNFLSLGGLPPFTGFLPKWIIIQNLSVTNSTLVTMMVILTLITLFFYIRLTYSALMINTTLISWNKLWHLNMPNLTILLNFFSLFGLILIMFLFVIL